MRALKIKLLIIALLAGIAGYGQTDTGFVQMNMVDTVYAGFGTRAGYTNIIFWSRSPDEKALYDSGRVEIIGDTITAIRRLSKDYDNIRSKYYESHSYVERIIDATADVITNGNRLQYDGKKIIVTNALDQEKRLRALIAAVRKYRAFVNGEQTKKKK